TEPPLRVSRTQLGGLLVPYLRRRRIGRDAPQILAAQHLRIIRPRQHQRRFRLLRVRGPFEQQSGGGDVADRKQALGPLQQHRKLVRIDASYRSCLACHRNGLTNGRSDRDHRGRRSYRRDFAGGFAGRRLRYRDLALERALIGGGDFVARRRCRRRCQRIGRRAASGRNLRSGRFGGKRRRGNALRLRSLRLRHGELGGRRRAAASATERGVEDDGSRRVDGEQRENGRDRRHHHDAGHDTSGARFLQPAATEPPVAARESIFGKLLVRLLLVVGEEKRYRLVWR